MAKEKKGFWDIIKKARLILVLLASISGICVAGLTFFAKSSTVEIMDKRLMLNTSADIVRSKENKLQWTKQQISFERRNDPKTPAEIAIVQRYEEEVEEARAIQKDREKRFEELYGEQL